MVVRGAVCVVVTALALTSACSGGSTNETSESPAPSPSSAAPTSEVPLTGRYVAIGDSYSAGPGIPIIDPESDLCLRSQSNFPSLLAAKVSTNLVDVSCSGATTQTATAGTPGVNGPIPPQLDALDAETDLVTVQLGGNDGGLFQTLLQACSNSASTCEQYVDSQAPSVLARTTDRVVTLLAEVESRAPAAEIVLVGYLRLSPVSGTCDELGVGEDAQDSVREAEVGLNDALAAAAQRAGVTFVSMLAASEGHDACAGEDAWTNGATASNGDGIIFHPRPAGIEAVATAVATAL